jgi:hypothetical protein
MPGERRSEAGRTDVTRSAAQPGRQMRQTCPVDVDDPPVFGVTRSSALLKDRGRRTVLYLSASAFAAVLSFVAVIGSLGRDLNAEKALATPTSPARACPLPLFVRASVTCSAGPGGRVAMGLRAVQFAEQGEPAFALDVFGCRCHSKGFCALFGLEHCSVGMAGPRT